MIFMEETDPGDNLFSQSVVAVDAFTGERRWHFQMIHHGLWDYDPPAAPNLIDITVEGRPIKALAQITKQGFVYTFDRETGEPVWVIEEREVPQLPLSLENVYLLLNHFPLNRLLLKNKVYRWTTWSTLRQPFTRKP